METMELLAEKLTEEFSAFSGSEGFGISSHGIIVYCKSDSARKILKECLKEYKDKIHEYVIIGKTKFLVE